MINTELELNIFVKNNDNNKYIVIQNIKISLENKSIASTKAIKGELLKLAKKKGVIVFWVDSNPESNQTYSKSNLKERLENSSNHLKDLGIDINISSSRKKRKRNRRLDPKSILKRSKSNNSYANGMNICIKECEPNTIGAHNIQKTVINNLVYYWNEWQRNNIDCIQKARINSFTNCESEMYDNRVNYCLVTSPTKPLREYHSIRKLLEVLYNTIRNHRSLLKNKKIIHQNISENNIIITKLLIEDNPKGKLIDLNLTKELNNLPNKTHHQTSTIQFIIIKILKDNDYIYQHNLESFFYIYIRYNYKDTNRQKPNKVMKVKTNILRGWYTRIYTDITWNKVGDIDKNRFEKIIVEFAPKFENLKPLVYEL
ncbi:hypothetical protein EAE96_000114 [Botrytis aclada]|nr:hypothetical protein EAE96_000114 [Botrytis aclada]